MDDELQLIQKITKTRCTLRDVSQDLRTVSNYVATLEQNLIDLEASLAKTRNKKLTENPGDSRQLLNG